MGSLLGRLACFLPLAALLMAVNYYVDPGHVFHRESYLRAIASVLLQGRNVAYQGGYDERLLHHYYMKGQPKRKDIIILGSSRMMQLRSSVFPGYRFYNNSLTLADLKDLLTIYGTYVAVHKEPACVLLGLDPWILNANSTRLKDAYALEAEYEEARRLLGLPPLTAHRHPSYLLRLKEAVVLFSPGYLQNSVDTLRSGGNGYRAVGDQDVDCCVRCSDGSLIYSRRYRTRPVPEVRRLAVDIGAPADVWTSYSALDPTLKGEFETFVDFLLARGVKVIFVLIPYHPATYPRMVGSRGYGLIPQVEQYFRSVAAKKHIDVVGSYDPTRLGCREDEFFDGVHPKDSCMDRIFREYFARGGDCIPPAKAEPRDRN